MTEASNTPETERRGVIPIYAWKCSKCQTQVEVVRGVDRHSVPPDADDLPPATEGVPACEHEWERQLGLTLPHVRAPSWGRKGHWLLPFVLAAASTLVGASKVQAYRLLDADDVSMEGYRILNDRDAYWPYADRTLGAPVPTSEYWTNGAAANLNLTLLQADWFRWYLNNRVHGESTNQQFRQIGWQYETGISVSEKVDAYWFHHSQHELDATPDGRFPLQNFVGIRVHFVRKGD